jgi:hypothetical protein
MSTCCMHVVLYITRRDEKKIAQGGREQITNAFTTDTVRRGEARRCRSSTLSRTDWSTVLHEGLLVPLSMS